MTITLNSEGQLTIPEQMLELLGWEPGSSLVLDANEKGELILRPERIAKDLDPDRFERVRGMLTPWPGGTDAYMAFIRGEE